MACCSPAGHPNAGGGEAESAVWSGGAEAESPGRSLLVKWTTAPSLWPHAAVTSISAPLHQSLRLQDTGRKSEPFLHSHWTHLMLGLTAESIRCSENSGFVFKSLSPSSSIFHPEKGIRVLYLKVLDIFFWIDRLLGPNGFYK